MAFYASTNFAELQAIYASRLRQFPARTPTKSLLALQLNPRHAAYMARHNLKKFEPYAGYVVQVSFEPQAQAALLKRVITRPADAVPSGRQLAVIERVDFDSFNQHIAPPIRVVGGYFGPGHKGFSPEQGELAGTTATQQLLFFEKRARQSEAALSQAISQHHTTVFLNYAFWLSSSDLWPDLEPNRQTEVMGEIAAAWREQFPDMPLPVMGEGMVNFAEEDAKTAASARALLQQVAQGKQPPSRDDVSRVLGELADVAAARGDLVQACRLWHKAHSIYSLFGIPALENLRDVVRQLDIEREDCETELEPVDLILEYLQHGWPET